jgi:cell division protein FtsZ
LTHGLGAGANPAVGRAAAQEVLPEIVDALDHVKLCFVVAGVGGGTGGGAAPVVARAARDRGILTIGIVIKPFLFEGRRRNRAADAAIQKMENAVDALVVVCNENLLRVSHPTTTFRQSLAFSDSIVVDSILNLAAMIDGPSLKHVTVADLRSVLVPGGRTVIAHGRPYSGDQRAARAADSALSNPLLDDAAYGARHVLLTISGGRDLGLFEVEQAVARVRANIHSDAELLWGSVIDPALEGVVRIGITAAGLPPRAANLNTAQAPLLACEEPSATAAIEAAIQVAIVAPQPDMCRPLSAPIVPPCTAPPLESLPISRRDGATFGNALRAMTVPTSFIADDLFGHPQPMASAAPEPELAPPAVPVSDARSPLVLVENYEVELRPPQSTRRDVKIHSRACSPSLVDRIYFAAVSMKYRMRREVRWIDQFVGKKAASS